MIFALLCIWIRPFMDYNLALSPKSSNTILGPEAPKLKCYTLEVLTATSCPGFKGVNFFFSAICYSPPYCRPATRVPLQSCSACRLASSCACAAFLRMSVSLRRKICTKSPTGYAARLAGTGGRLELRSSGEGGSPNKISWGENPVVRLTLELIAACNHGRICVHST